MITAVQEEKVAKSLEEKLEGLAVEIRYGAPLSEFTTFQIGGPADALALPRGEEELLALIARCREERLPISLLGGGANTLVLDGGVRGVVISPALGFREVEITEEGPKGALLDAGAGAKIPSVARLAAERGLTGLECVFGVPGTVGGALAMNAGTAERYIGEAVESVRWIPFAGDGVERLPAGRLSFAYRQTVFPGEGIVLGVRFRLGRGDAEDLLARLRENAAARRERQPTGLPCAGSIFRNPPDDRAGRLIEEAGLKGRRVGGAEVSRVHANFLVNTGGATAADVLALIGEVQAAVRERHGVDLALELKVMGEEAP
ncbi:MAG: UDP-N-acetylmuramate dehydrogenase [bacterium]